MQNTIHPTFNRKKNPDQRRRRPASVQEVLRNKEPGTRVRRTINKLLRMGRLVQGPQDTLVRASGRSRKAHISYRR